MPERWRETTLGAVVQHSRGSIKTGPFGTALKAAEYTEHGTPVISTGEVGYGRLKLHERTPRLGGTALARLSDYLLVRGDIVFSRKGSIDRSAWISAAEDGYFLGSDALRVRLGTTDYDSRFLAYSVLSPTSRNWLIQHSSGTTMPSMNQEILGRLPVLVPPLAEQRRIAGVLGAFDDLIDTNAQIAARAQSLAVALLDGAAGSVPLSNVAEPVKSSMFRPTGAVEHYSLPAFDAGGLPELIDGSAIKSGKQRVMEPAVLVSRLNPQTPRVWMAYPSGVAAASTEFVVLAGKADVAVEEVWATCCTDSFVAEMRSRVTGTTGSHQRVDKAAIPTIEVADPRSLRAVDRDAVVALVQEGQASRDEAARLSRTRDELLPLLMSGRVSVDEAWEAAVS